MSVASAMEKMEQLGSAEKLELAWSRVSKLLHHHYGEAIHKSWFSNLKPMEFLHSKVYIKAPSLFIKDWINTHYLDQLKKFWQQCYEDVNEVEITTSNNIVISHGEDKEIAIAGVAESLVSSYDLEDWEAELDPKLTFDTFIVGKPNEFAYAAARRVAEANIVPFNPLFLYGGVGLGKTHLMRAIAWKMKMDQPSRRVIYLSAEKFMYLFIRALRYKDTIAFKEQFRKVDVLMVDDFQFICGKDSTQEEFFYTFNSLVDQNKQIIISADKSPLDLQGVEERMRSRLSRGLVADIHPMNYELRLAILQSKVEQTPIMIPTRILEMLASKITSNVRELEGALNRLVAHAMLISRDVTFDMATEVLKDLFKENEFKFGIEEIQKKVAEHFDISIVDIQGESRLRALARPRQVAMYLSKQLTTASLPEIGRKFGGRDHTTVMHAVEKIQELRDTDLAFDTRIRTIEKALNSVSTVLD